MITQAIKHWLSKMFAWWPWKHVDPPVYSQQGGLLSAGTTKEGASLSAMEGNITQASMTPRLSTIDEHPDRIIPVHSPTTDDFAETTAPPSLRPPLDISTEPGGPLAPSPQQRLEFLKYLVTRGIINEGFDEK